VFCCVVLMSTCWYCSCVSDLFMQCNSMLPLTQIARYVVVQGGCCFIFLESTDPSPLYAFSLHELTVEMEDPNNPDKYSVTVNPVINDNTTSADLETILFRNADTGKIAFQFTFDKVKDSHVAERFLHIVQHVCHRGTTNSGGHDIS
jgi:hypothetical protein